MTMEFLIVALFAVSLLTNLTVEGIKKLLDKKSVDYSLSCIMSAGIFRAIIPFLSELMGGMDGVRINLTFSMPNVWKVWGIGVIVLILITFIVMLPCLTKKIKDTLSEMEG